MEQEAKVDAPPLLISAKLAKALANPWRNRILMELHLRPMSASQFCEEFGGTLPVIARYFRELREWDFLEVAEELRGGGRRGGVEKVYRAIRRAYFDTATWEELPRYLRRECSGSVLQGLLLRISQAVEAGTFDAESDRHLSWRGLPFDRRAWGEFVTRLDEVLEWINVLETESAERAAAAKVESLPVTMALLAFRSPAEPTELRGQGELPRPETGGPAGPTFLISPQLAKALANPWRNLILMELHLRPMSPSQFFEQFGGPDLATIARYFRQLRKWGYLEVAEELRGGGRRGALEKVYRAVRRAQLDTTSWEELPPRLRRECSGAALEGLIARIDEAVAADTFDAETDRHLSWKAVRLDRQAWSECGAMLDDVLAWVEQLESEASARITAGEAEAIPATVALMSFRSPEFRRP
jgi:DNA-binding transcriptional ArsR family regulator